MVILWSGLISWIPGLCLNLAVAVASASATSVQRTTSPSSPQLLRSDQENGMSPSGVDSMAEVPSSKGLVIFTLVRGGRSAGDFDDFVNSRRCLSEVMPRRIKYDNVIFHEGNVPLQVQSELVEQIPRLRFMDVHAHGGFQRGLSNVHFKELVEEGDASNYPMGYRHMCHFMSILWFGALHDYQYAMRVDDDVCLTRLPTSTLLAALSADYAYGLETRETHEITLQTLGPWLRRHMASSGLQPTIPPLPTENIFLTNFFVARVQWWEQAEVSRFLREVNESGNIYRHRWGDAPIQTAALRLLASPPAVVHLDIDYLHVSTQKRVVNGEEVQYIPDDVHNTHFRQLKESSTNCTTNVSECPPLSSSDAVSDHCTGECCDTAEVFSTIGICAGGNSCSNGIPTAGVLVGSAELACGLTVEEMDAAADSFGCPLPFEPPVPRTTLLSVLCPRSCSSAGVVLAGCTESPPSPPVPPTPPPLPPLTPAPSGFTTVATVSQLRALLAAADGSDTLSIYIPPGSIFFLDGSSLVVNNISLRLSSDGEGATIDGQHLSRVLQLQPGARVWLDSLTLANGFVSGNGGIVAMSTCSVVANQVFMVNSSVQGNGGAMFVTGSVLVGNRLSFANTSALASGGAIAILESFMVLTNRSSVFSSTSYFNGGALYAKGGSVTMTGVSIANSSAVNGGAIYLDAGRVTVSSCQIAFPRSTRDGGFAYVDSGSMTVANDASIHSPTANWNGGCVFLRTGDFTATNKTHVSGSFAVSRGGGLYISGGWATIANSSSLVRSTATDGGGFFLATGIITVASDVLISDSSAAYGAAILVEGGTVLITDNCSVLHSHASWRGGAFHVTSGVVTVRHCLVADSSARQLAGAIHVDGGLVTLENCTLLRADCQRAGCFNLVGGEFHLASSVVEGCTSSKLEGVILMVPADTVGAGPLLLITRTEFRQHECAGSLFNQKGVAQVILRDISFTPLGVCENSSLASPEAFAGMTTLGCGQQYTDRQQQSWGVCSLDVKGACSLRPVANTPLQMLLCQCPQPEFIPDPAVSDVHLAPFLRDGCIVKRNGVVRLGVLLPMFRTAVANYSAVDWSPRAGVYQALQEINDKSDGVSDELLPNTQLWFAYRDSKCDSTKALTDALHLTQFAFGGKGVSAIIGAGCSEASVSAAQVATGSRVPIISPTSLSPSLSDGQKFPFFLRVFPSMTLTASAMVDVLQHLLKYSRVALAYSVGHYGEEGAYAFSEAGLAAGMAISATVSFRPSATDFSSQHGVLIKSSSRVIVLIAQASAGAHFLRSAVVAGVGGKGFLYMLSDAAVREERYWSSNGTLRRLSLRGSFTLVPDDGKGTARHTAFLARREESSRWTYANGSCSLEKDDDDSAYLWGQYREASVATDFECAPENETGYHAFGYDAAFAVAYALHNLLEVQGRDLVGSDLLDTLLTRVSFQGLTGLVDFQQSSADNRKLYRGDRGRGASYMLQNYVDNRLPAVTVGRWSPCNTSICEWSERWQERGQALTFSTDENSKPQQHGSCSYGLVLTPEGECVCDVGFKVESEKDGQCVPCPAFTSSAGGESPCDVCAMDRYLIPGGIASTEKCKPCPTGAKCAWNTTQATLQMMQGYWRLATSTAKIYKCESAEDSGHAGTACVCMGGTAKDDICAAGHAGPLCKVCLVDNQYFSDGSCQECPDTGIGVFVAAVICIGILLLIIVLNVIHEQTGEALACISVPLRRWTHWFKDFCEQVGVVTKLKLALTFAQVIAALDGTYEVGLPRSWFTWTAVIRFWGDLNWAGWVVPSECLVTTALRMLLLRALVPLAVVVAMPIISATLGLIKTSRIVDKLGSRLHRRGGSPPECQERDGGLRGLHIPLAMLSDGPSRSAPSISSSPASTVATLSSERTPKDPPTFKRTVVAGALKYLPVSLALAFCFTPSVSVSIFSSWKCLPYEFDETEEYKYLASDLSVRCDGDNSDEYSQLTAAAWILIGVWPIGMVIINGVLLIKCHKLLREEKYDAPLVLATSFLHQDYKSGFFWWEVISLLQRTALTGWLLLLDSELSFIRILTALIISIAFLIVLLALKPYRRKLDYAMAAGCQILFVCIFIGGIIVRLYEDIANDTNGSADLAHRYLGLRSSEHVIVIMIIVALTMLLLLAFTLASESYALFLHKRLTQRWSVCTMDPPFINWRPRGIYACFLSHYKAESASDARYMHDMLRKMLKAPVFLDSSVLSDLRNLITDGVHKSDTMVLLVTKGVFSRPWCLLELLEVARKGIPVVMVQMASCSLDLGEARRFIDDLEAYLRKTNPAGLELLQQKVGPNLGELKVAVHHALDANLSNPLVFGSHSSDNDILATMKDVVERMATATGRNIKWEGHKQPKMKRAKRSGRKWSLQLARLPRMMLGERVRRMSAVWHTSAQDIVNVGSSIYVCCSREDAASHARVLRSELELKLGRACAIGGGRGTATLIEESQLAVVLLTKRLLSDSVALFEIWKALQCRLPMVTVAIIGAGYDYAEASTVYSDLQSALDHAQPGASYEMAQLLPEGVSISDAGEQLYSTLMAIIALSWAPASSKHQMDALVEDIVARVPCKKRAHSTRKTELQSCQTSLKNLSVPTYVAARVMAREMATVKFRSFSIRLGLRRWQPPSFQMQTT